MSAFQINPGPLYRPSVIVRDERYKAFLRGFPCVGCGTMRKAREAAHIGPHGLSQKASDLDCLPMCGECHRSGPQALHKIGPVKFQEKRGIDFAALARIFRRFYRLKHGTPEHWPNMPELHIFECECGVEDFTEELLIRGKCAECGREYRREKAA